MRPHEGAVLISLTNLAFLNVYQSVVPLLLLSPMKPPRAATDEAINTIIPIGDSGTTEKGTSNEATTARMWRDSATTVQ